MRDTEDATRAIADMNGQVSSSASLFFCIAKTIYRISTAVASVLTTRPLLVLTTLLLGNTYVLNFDAIFCLTLLQDGLRSSWR